MGEAGSERGGLGLYDRTPGLLLPLTLRDEDQGDRALVRHLFETGLGAHLFCCGLPSIAVGQLITQQLVARERGHAANHPLARRHIVSEGRRPVGRLSIDRAAHPWYLVDLTVLPDARGRGIASELLAGLKAEARAAGVAIELHVAEDSPALRLYLRNDFVVTAAEGPDLRMRWAPA
jgi:GNAT superfamily N-acetyltransferase